MDAYEQFQNMSREQVIALLCSSGYIIALPLDQQGEYLFGRTKNNRAVCLAWDEQDKGNVSQEVLFEKTAREIHQAGLLIPLLFFGRTCSIAAGSFFTFAQIPWFFEQDRAILRTLQGMNMRANLCPLEHAERPEEKEAPHQAVAVNQPDAGSSTPRQSEMSDAVLVQWITARLVFHTGKQWTVLYLTHYEQHWVVVAYQGGILRAFLFEQTPEGELAYAVAEKTLFRSTQSQWRYSTGSAEPLKLITYVVQYGGESCRDYTDVHDYSLEELREYLLDVHDPATDVLITAYYDQREDGEGRYHKHPDGTFSVVYEEAGIAGLLKILQLHVLQDKEDEEQRHAL